MDYQALRSLGWKPWFQQQLTEADMECDVARVAAHYGSQLLLWDTDGEFTLPVQLTAACPELTVGDWVVVQRDTGRAVRSLERETLIARKSPGRAARAQLIAANIDTLFIVSSCNQEFNPRRLERYLAIALDAGAVPVIVLTKVDLCDDPAVLRQQAQQLHSGIVVESIDARDPHQTRCLEPWCGTGRTVALVGSSGVGKSTLATSLGAGELATGPIRSADDKGRHTTTARSLHRLRTGGVLIDNPGMRELQLTACEDGLTDLFDEIIQRAEQCRFRDCRHRGDAGCAVEAAVESGEIDPGRLESYRKLEAEQAWNARTLAERRRTDRELGRFYRSVLSHKRNSRAD